MQLLDDVDQSQSLQYLYLTQACTPAHFPKSYLGGLNSTTTGAHPSCTSARVVMTSEPPYSERYLTIYGSLNGDQAAAAASRPAPIVRR